MVSGIEELRYHLVWCVKYRYKLLTPEIAQILKDFFFNKQSIWKIEIISLSIEPDHIHMLFKVVSSQIDINKLIKRIKGSSSHFIRRKFPYLQVYPSLWTASHYLGTTGEVSDKTIENYINNQGLQEEEIVKRTFVYKVLKSSKKKEHQLNTWLKDFKTRPKGLQSGYQGKFPDQICLRNDLIKIEPSQNVSCNYWLTLPGGNGWKQISIGLLGRTLPQDAKIKDSKIIKKDDTFWVHLNIEQRRIIQNNLTPSKIRAVDLGISHPITSVLLEDNHLKDYQFWGKELKCLLYKRQKRASKLQKYIKKLSKKLRKYTLGIKDWTHKYTKEIVNKAQKENACLVVGNIHNITRKWDKKEKERNNQFRRKAKPVPYGKIMSQLWYKGTLAGVQVIFQDEAYTSQRCSRCGELGCRTNEWFVCKNCGYVNQADVNGAVNIALAYQRDYNGLVRLPGSLQETYDFNRR